MKTNDTFKAVFVCAILMIAFMVPELWAESTSYDKQLATQNSQALIDRLNAVEKKYEPKVKSAKSERDINKRLYRYGMALNELSGELCAVISQSDAPDEVKKAALEYVEAISELSLVCLTAPRLPASNVEAFVDGAIHGLWLDSSRPAKLEAEMKGLRQRYDAAFAVVARKSGRLKVIAIKYGVKYQ